MCWASETAFVDAFVASQIFPTQAKTSRVRVFREVRTGYGRPDIAVVEFDPEVIRQRRGCGLPDSSLSTIQGYALAYLAARRWVGSEQLGQFLNIHGRALEGLMKDLTARGLVERRRHLVKARPRSKTLAIRKLWVFEAKLHQWRQAVDQAERHLWFTSDSYVLMPDHQPSLLRMVSLECVKRGLGFGVFGSEMGYKLLVRPSRSGIINSPLLWTINEQLLLEEGDSNGSLCAEFTRVDSCFPVGAD